MREDALAAAQSRVDEILLTVQDPAWRRKFYVHLYGVAQCAAMLALRRGLNPELAAAAGMLHDISAATIGNYDSHCLLSADAARELLAGTGLFGEEELEAVYNAILRHDDRDGTDEPFDEILKDADILHPYLLSLKEPRSLPAAARLESMRLELSL